jgi:hypothetical protein
LKVRKRLCRDPEDQEVAASAEARAADLAVEVAPQAYADDCYQERFSDYSEQRKEPENRKIIESARHACFTAGAPRRSLF